MAKYVLMPKLLTPDVDPGTTIELEIFITGAGPVETNKLFLNYPSAIVNKEDAGEVIASISTALETGTNRIITPVAGNHYLTKFRCDAIGIVITITQGFFLENPHDNPTKSGELRRIMAECKFDNHAPLLLKLNTSKQAPSGDHEIGLALSYSSSGEIEITKETVKVHIRNWVERHPRIIVAGIIASILSAIVGGVALWKALA